MSYNADVAGTSDLGQRAVLLRGTTSEAASFQNRKGSAENPWGAAGRGPAARTRACNRDGGTLTFNAAFRCKRQR
jgi:hypothetical protein